MLTVCMLVHRRRTTAPRMQTSKRDEDKEREEGVQNNILQHHYLFLWVQTSPGQTVPSEATRACSVHIYPRSTYGAHKIPMGRGEVDGGSFGLESIQGTSERAGAEEGRRLEERFGCAAARGRTRGAYLGCTVPAARGLSPYAHRLYCLFFRRTHRRKSKREKEKNPNNKTP